jgi:branched-chain amino acid aminotransferase
MTSHNVHYLNGKLVSDAELTIQVRDLGYIRGYGVFDFLITYQNGKPFHLTDHIERFLESARIIDLTLPYSAAQIREIVLQTLDANPTQGEKSIRLIASGGVGPDGLTQSETPSFICMVEKRVPSPSECFDPGAKVALVHYQRSYPEAKTLNYIAAVVSLKRARREHQAYEVIFHNGKEITEGATSNVFVVKNGIIATPADEILRGVTRKVLLELLPEVEVRPVTVDEFKNADEVFLAASNKEVMPVVFVDSRTVGTGRIGAVTQKVMSIFEKYTQSSEWFDTI